MSYNSVKHIDLFSGIGGFSLAARWLDLQTIAQVEIDAYCQEKLQKNFPDVPKYRDITDFKPMATDVITAGLPCQPFSVAGKQLGKADPRYLWDETFRVVCQSACRLFILENVQGLLTNDKGSTFAGILRDLSKAGFNAVWYTVPATAVEAIHKRARIWLIAWQPITHTQSIQRQQPGSNDLQTRADSTLERQAAPTGLSRELSKWCSSWSSDGISRRLARVADDDNVCCMPSSWNELNYRFKDAALNGDRTDANRKAIKAYGNAIVPQIAYCVLDYGLSKIGVNRDA